MRMKKEIENISLNKVFNFNFLTLILQLFEICRISILIKHVKQSRTRSQARINGGNIVYFILINNSLV